MSGEVCKKGAASSMGYEQLSREPKFHTLCNLTRTTSGSFVFKSSLLFLVGPIGRNRRGLLGLY